MWSIMRIGLFLFSLFLCYEAQERPPCQDKYQWCKTQQHYCSLKYARDNCPKTCDACPDVIDECALSGCQQHCRSNNNKVTCECHKGYRLNSDGKTCSDINECDNPSICRQPESPVCINTEGSFTCGACMTKKGHITYYKSFTCCAQSDIRGCGQNKANGVPGPAGPEVILSMWPWTVLLLIDGSYCTGTLISDQWILTSAHCFSKLSFGTTKVEALVGIRSTNINESNSNSRKIKINRIEVHNNYHFPHNDIALAHLATKVEKSWAIRPICLPNGEVPNKNVKCFMSGFEAIYNDVGVYQEMNEAEVTVSEAAACRRNLGNLGKVFDADNTLCGKFNMPTQPVCPGETGGPIVCQRCDSCDWYVAGLMSFGDMCLTGRDAYGSFISVESYEDWISEITNMTLTKSGSCSSFVSGWRPWSGWTTCTKTCDGGQRSRFRECARGSPGRPSCSGLGLETSKCNSNKCPKWGQYSQWSSCSVTCGQGKRSRSRSCMDGYVGQVGCDVGGIQETEECIVEDCAYWSEWSPFSECSATCGSSVYRTATRECITYSDNDDVECEGDEVLVEKCHLSNICPKWSDWSNWSECSISCGGRGLRTSKRTCLTGNDCVGARDRAQVCDAPQCPSGCEDNSNYLELCRYASTFCNNSAISATCPKTCKVC